MSVITLGTFVLAAWLYSGGDDDDRIARQVHQLSSRLPLKLHF
jgi:hypothetical protein